MLYLLYAVVHMHDSLICVCLKLAFREQLRQTLTYADKIVKKFYVGRTPFSRVKILAPWSKGAHNGIL